MKVLQTKIKGIRLIEPKVFSDDRGFFLESFNPSLLAEITGTKISFVQDNHSYSYKYVLRGLHYQVDQPQGKLVRVVTGEVFDVAVDLRRGSSTFGQWVGFYLSEKNKKMAWIPEGFAHGFLVLSETVDFLYKVTTPYNSQSERCIRWNDPDLAIDWPIQEQPIVSAKDADGCLLKEAEVFESR